MAAPIAAAAIPAAASLIGSGINAMSTNKLNKATMEWNERMYGRQRQDAESDWLRQLQYDHPKAQMERYTDAGLNPHLIYGQMSNSPVIKSTDVKSWNPQVPDWGSGIAAGAERAVSTYYDVAMQNEQIKNMEAQRKNMTLQAMLQGIAITGGQTRNELTAIARDLALDTYQSSVDYANEKARGLGIINDVRVKKEARDAVMGAANLSNAVARLGNIGADTALKKQQVKNMLTSDQLNVLERNMRRLGLSYHDGVILRVLAQFAEGKSLPEVVKNLWDVVQRFGRTVGKTRDEVDVK